jgi:hypothetical protein
MEQISFLECNTCSGIHAILILLWDMKVHLRLHVNPLMVSILKQRNPVHNLKPHFFNTHLNVIL